jgi:hypothetical protein
MACQPVAEIHNFEAKVRLTKRRMLATKRHIHRIEMAKVLVCGVPSSETISKLRREFENLLPLLEEGFRLLNSGFLDTKSDAELRELLAEMQERNAKMSFIYDGSLRIGLGAVEPFPSLLSQFKAHQERLQSQIEGIVLSLSDSFQDLVEKSSQEITTHP